jgi:hypothetical protein
MAVGETFEFMDITVSAIVQDKEGNSRVIFRDLSFNETHDTGSVDNILSGMANCGWTILNVVIVTGNDSCWTSIKDFRTVHAVFDALFESPDKAGVIVAYGELFGWDYSGFERNRWGRKYEEGYQGVYDDEEEFAREFVDNEDFYQPWWLSIDWEDTTATIMNDHASHEYGYETYVFVNH